MLQPCLLCLFHIPSNVWITVYANNGGVNLDGGRASSRRRMSLETLLEAARYVELQEAQRLQQSSESSLARGVAGMLKVVIIIQIYALISDVSGILCVYRCECIRQRFPVCYAKCWCEKCYAVQVSRSVLYLYSLSLLCPEDGMLRRALSIAVTGPEGCRPRHGHNDQMRRKLSRAVTV